ncbi:ras guanine nucleotide exchange factor domain-containing protein [Gorgonomyces haynaldii]|nr:ras guanine nucleotide exchange factor domain-containing protein [Gorgonomyces haynaldii]
MSQMHHLKETRERSVSQPRPTDSMLIDGELSLLLKQRLKGVKRSNSFENQKVYTPRAQEVLEPIEVVDNFDILAFSPLELARQMTLLNAKLFRSIPRKELETIGWVGNERESRAPHILQVAQQFNTTALWVADQILNSKKIKRRFLMLVHLIKLAEQLRRCNNFDGLRAVIAGLQSTPVFRLEKTWGMLGSRERETFDKLAEIADPENNFQAYRQLLISAAAPFVPYLGTHLTDLLFLSDMLKTESRNPEKMQQAKEREEQLSQMLDELQQMQQACQYPFKLNEELVSRIFSQITPEQFDTKQQEQYRKSYEIEEKGGNGEPDKGWNIPRIDLLATQIATNLSFLKRDRKERDADTIPPRTIGLRVLSQDKAVSLNGRRPKQRPALNPALFGNMSQDDQRAPQSAMESTFPVLPPEPSTDTPTSRVKHHRSTSAAIVKLKQPSSPKLRPLKKENSALRHSAADLLGDIEVNIEEPTPIQISPVYHVHRKSFDQLSPIAVQLPRKIVLQAVMLTRIVIKGEKGDWISHWVVLNGIQLSLYKTEQKKKKLDMSKWGSMNMLIENKSSSTFDLSENKEEVLKLMKAI